jgi:hypothetical protein
MEVLLCPVMTPRNFITRPPANVDLKLSGRTDLSRMSAPCDIGTVVTAFVASLDCEMPLKRQLRIRQTTTGLKAGVNGNQYAIANRQSKISSPTCRPPK